jgi:hypothetical protein
VFSLKRVIIANARYWLDYLNGRPEDAVLADADIRGAARALEAVMTVSEVWPCTQSLALALHPHMERQGYWTDWDEFLKGLTVQARKQADTAAEEALLIRRGALSFFAARIDRAAPRVASPDRSRPARA